MHFQPHAGLAGHLHRATQTMMGAYPPDMAVHILEHGDTPLPRLLGQTTEYAASRPALRFALELGPHQDEVTLRCWRHVA
jgi:hypothetical protein